MKNTTQSILSMINLERSILMWLNKRRKKISLCSYPNFVEDISQFNYVVLSDRED
jgi:hypothetical protein